MKRLLFLLALAVSAQQIKINPITGLPDLVGSGGGGGGATSVTAGATGALVISPTTGAVVVDVDTAYVPNKAGAQTIIGDWTFYDTTAVTGSTLLTVRAGAGQSGNIMEWQDSGGNQIASVRQQGYFRSTNMQVDAGGGTGVQMTSAADGVMQLQDFAGSSFDQLQLGGSTSSFPAIKRLNANVEFKLADGSNYTNAKYWHYIAAGTAPTITSGFGTSPSIAGADGAGRVTVGTGGTAATGTITFGQAWATAPVCTAANETTQLALFPTATTTTLVLASTTPFTAADKLVFTCVGY
jgi:hypothetical protein